MRPDLHLRPSGCSTPSTIRSVIGVAALPMLICRRRCHRRGRRDSRPWWGPVIACLVEGVGRGGRPRRVRRDRAVVDDAPAARHLILHDAEGVLGAQEGPLRLVLTTTACHCSRPRFSNGTAGAPVPALLNSRSSLQGLLHHLGKQSRDRSRDVDHVSLSIGKLLSGVPAEFRCLLQLLGRRPTSTAVKLLSSSARVPRRAQSPYLRRSPTAILWKAAAHRFPPLLLLFGRTLKTVAETSGDRSGSLPLHPNNAGAFPCRTLCAVWLTSLFGVSRHHIPTFKEAGSRG